MVSEIDVKLQLRLLEVRRELERPMASLAAERAIQEERREFTEVAEAMLAAAARPMILHSCASISASTA